MAFFFFYSSAACNGYRQGRIAVASKQREQEGQNMDSPCWDCC